MRSVGVAIAVCVMGCGRIHYGAVPADAARIDADRPDGTGLDGDRLDGDRLDARTSDTRDADPLGDSAVDAIEDAAGPCEPSGPVPLGMTGADALHATRADGFDAAVVYTAAGLRIAHVRMVAPLNASEIAFTAANAAYPTASVTDVGLAVVWATSAASGYDLKMRLLDGAGPIGSEIDLPDSGDVYWPSIVAARGGFAVAWHDSDAAMYAVTLDGAGATTGGPSAIASTFFDENPIAIVPTATGFAATWRAGYAASARIEAALLDAEGALDGTIIGVTSGDRSVAQPRLVATPSGFLVTYVDSAASAIFARALGADGSLFGTEARLSDTLGSVDFAIAWTGERYVLAIAHGPPRQLRVEAYGEDLSFLGNAVLATDAYRPQVVAASDRSLVTWWNGTTSQIDGWLRCH